MMPGMNPKQMAAAMKAMGIKQKEIEASEVVIKTPSGDLVIKDPKVMEVEMQGIKTYQIVGEVQEKAISDEDVALVSKQAGVDIAAARAALERSDGDIAQAILELG